MTTSQNAYKYATGLGINPTPATTLVDMTGELGIRVRSKGRSGPGSPVLFKGHRLFCRYLEGYMAFRVIPVKRLQGPQFKVMFEWWDEGVRKYRAVSREDWVRHGFSEGMSLQAAKLHKDSLNAKERLSRAETRRQKTLARMSREKLEQQAYLPDHDVEAFEAQKLALASSKAKSYWATARRIITAIPLPPSDWEEKADRFYLEFIRRQMSPAYVQKVLPLINKWGAFIARRRGQAFLPIPPPSRAFASQLAENHINKESGKGNRESDPLSSVQLTKAKKYFLPEMYQWLLYAVWFGLRPIEIDLLSKASGKKTWWVTQDRVPVLWVYQTKLKGLKADKRVKYIPAILPEQRALIESIGQKLRRPTRKRMKNAFGGPITLYGGRKNFVQLMKSKGQSFENVSAWLGHTDLDRTYQDYFNKQEVKFDPAA